MSAIPAGALPPNEVTMVPKRLLQDVLEILSFSGVQNIYETSDLVNEITGILEPGNPRYHKR